MRSYIPLGYSFGPFVVMLRSSSWDAISSPSGATEVVKWASLPSSYAGGLPYASGVPATTKICTAYKQVDASNIPNGALVAVPKRGYNTTDLGVLLGDVTAAPELIYDLAIEAQDGTNNNFVPLAGNQNLNFNPSTIPDDFSIGRVSAYAASVVSATTSTTSAALSGSIDAGAITDFRDLKQFDATELQQIAVTDKDAVVGIRAQEGAIVLAGPDISEHFTPSDEYRANQLGFGSGDVPISTIQGATDGIHMMYLVPGFDVAAGSGSPYTVEKLARQPYWLPKSVKGQFNVEGVAPATAMSTLVKIVPLFVAFNPTGPSTVEFSFAHTEMNAQTYLQEIDYNDITKIFSRFSASFTPPQHYAFIGFTLDINVALTGGGSATLDITSLSYQVHNLYEDRNMGSVRVIYWRGMAAGQLVTVRGILAYEGAVTGSLTNYLKANARFARQIPYQLLYDVRQMYNNPACSLLRRVYDLPTWLTSLGNDVANMMSSYVTGTASSFDDFLRGVNSTVQTIGNVANVANGVMGNMVPLISGFASSEPALRRRKVDGPLSGLAAGMLGSAAGMLY